MKINCYNGINETALKQRTMCTWGCHPSSSGQRKEASFTACCSMANFGAPLFTPKCSWRSNEDKMYFKSKSSIQETLKIVLT